MTLTRRANQKDRSFVTSLPSHTCARVPSLHAESANGPLRFEGFSGKISASVQNGPLAFRECIAAIDARAQNGPISVRLSGASWRDGKLDGHAVNGPLSLHIPDGYRSATVVERNSRRDALDRQRSRVHRFADGENRLMRRALAIMLLLGSAAVSASADTSPAGLTNARVKTRDASTGLDRAFRGAAASASPVRVGYAVPSPEGRLLCCGDSWNGDGCSGRCALEHDGNSQTIERPSRGELASGSRMIVFSRAEKGRTTRLRLFSDSCTIDGGGMPVVWLTAVRPRNQRRS